MSAGAERRGEEEDGQAGPSGAPGPSAQLMESEDQNGQHSGEADLGRCWLLRLLAWLHAFSLRLAIRAEEAGT